MALKKNLKGDGNWLFKHRSTLPISHLLVTLVYPQSTLQASIAMACSIHIELISLAISMSVLGIRLCTLRHTSKNTLGRNTRQGQKEDTLDTTGMSRVVRHPLFLGNFFVVRTSLANGKQAVITAFISISLVVVLRTYNIYRRAILKRKFGEQYIAWANNVPAFIRRLVFLNPYRLALKRY